MRGRAAASSLALLALLADPRPARADDPPTDDPLADPPPRYDLAAWESAAILGVGTTWYWLDRRTNQQDWDDPPFLARFQGDSWRLDNNRFGINFVGHPLTGALSYGLARAHRIGPGGAFGFALGTSLLWELGVEFREKVSINDVVVTGPAAVPIGELAYKAGVEVAEAFGEAGPRASRDRWRRARLSLDAGALARSPLGPGSYARIGLDADLVWLPKYRNEGTFSAWFGQAEVVSGRFEVPAAAHGSGFEGEATAVLAGFHTQAIEGEGEGRRGFSVTVGTPIAFRYVASSALGFRELLATTRLPGLDLRGTLELPPLSFEAGLGANLDFAGMTSPAHEAWIAANPEAVGKTILRRQRYFYGLGPSARAHARVRFGRCALFAEAEGLIARSIDGVDRTQETLTRDERLWSEATRARVALEVALAPAWSVQVRGEATRWRSRVEEVSATIRSDVVGAALVWSP